MSEFEWVAIAIVTILSAARITRLVTVDKFPPIKWLRTKYEDWTDPSDWQWLTMCGYCFSFWATLGVVLSGWLSDWHTAWWVINSILAASYAAAIVMAFDGDPGDNAKGVE